MTEPVVTSTVVLRDLDAAFDLWAGAIDTWWPRDRTIGGADRVEAVVLEPGIGGRLYERWADGAEHPWGEVTEWAPPARLALAWRRHGDDPAATEVLVEFVAEGPATTRVRVTHSGWGALRDPAAERARYQPGPGALWSAVNAALGGTSIDPAVHRFFGVRANNTTWSHLDPLDVAAALHAAHAAAWHWGHVGAPENLARAAWLVSHVYAVVGWAEPARCFAERCMALTAEHGLVDFDLAYAHEAVARAAAAAGDMATARHHRAIAAGVPVADAEDAAIVQADLAAEPWYGA